MTTEGSKGNPMDGDDKGCVLRQYLANENETDDDNNGWTRPSGGPINDDYDDYDDDSEYNEQRVPKQEPGIEVKGEQRNVAPVEANVHDVELGGHDPLDEVDPDAALAGPADDIEADIDEEAEVEADAEFMGSEGPEDLAPIKDVVVPLPPSDPNVWTLPADKDICTLEEIRRGQVINKVAPNECPVMGCGKKINEMRAEPSPGTIASGLRTHVLFVHYAMTCKRAPKKRKLAWSGKRRGSASPKKPFAMSQGTDQDYDMEPENFAMPINDMHHSSLPGASLMQRSLAQQHRNPSPSSILNNKIRQISANNVQTPQSNHQSSLQSLMQATGMGFGMNNGARYSPQSKQRGHDLSASQKSFNQTTSSLFSILAGLTQQPQQNQQHSHQQNQHNQQANHRANLSLTSASQQQVPRTNAKPAHGANTLSLSQCSRNGNSNNNFITNPPITSSLLTMLNEKISGSVASSLQSQLKKSIDQNNKIPATSNSRINTHQNNNQYYQNNLSNNDNQTYNNINHALLNNMNMGNADSRQTNGENGASTLNPFIESIARKTGSNIGPGGVAETKKIIEKFVTWLMHSSQTIADHYIAPYSGEAPQQKPEISASDVILAYKMMQKSQPQ